jgi:LEA14-like dessication related protein
MVKKVRLFFLLTFLFAVSCRSFEEIELKGISNVSFRGIENNTVRFSAGLQVYNPTAYGIKIKELSLKTIANGDYLGTLRCDDDIRIAARKDSIYMANLNLKLANILSGAAAIYKLSRQDKVRLEVQGYVKARTMMLTRKIEVAETRMVDMPKFR